MAKHLDYLSGVSQEVVHSILSEKDKLIQRYAEENSKLRARVERLEHTISYCTEYYALDLTEEELINKANKLSDALEETKLLLKRDCEEADV